MKDKFSMGMEQMMDNFHTTGSLLTVGDINKANTMTISWGSIGFMWKKPVFMIMVRESRYSNEFLGLGKTFTVSIPYDKKMKEAIGVCGSKSGRDIDKAKEANFTYAKGKAVDTPVVNDCDKYYECKIVLKQELDLDNMNEDIKKAIYPDTETNHILYFGEILEQY